MKKLIPTIALLSSLQAFAQSNPDNISGDQAAPASAPVFKALVTRIHTLGIDDKVFMMKQNGLTESKHVAVFNAQGALVYDHEIGGKGFFDDDSNAGRNAGFQVLPYNISLTSDNRVFISGSAVAWKNMNAEMQDEDLDYCDGYSCDQNGNAWNVIDNIEVMKIEYNKDFNMNDVKEFKWKLGQIDTKLNIMPDLPKNQYLALKMGAAPIGYSDIQFKNMTMITNVRDNPTFTLTGFEASGRYGLEYNLQTSKGLRFNAEAMFNNQWNVVNAASYYKTQDFKTYDENMGKYQTDYNQYSQDKAEYQSDMNQWKDDKALYESTHLNGTVISTESYVALTGNQAPTFTEKEPTKPKEPGKYGATRSVMFFTPKIEFSKKISKEGKSPVRLGVRFSANIPLFDTIKLHEDDTKVDLKDRYNPIMLNTGIFLNF